MFANSPEVIGAIGAELARPRSADADKQSSFDAMSYPDPDAAKNAVIAAPGSPAATAVEVAPLAPPVVAAPPASPTVDPKPAS